ncbi:unnamed protein product [Didymodactylos carnosus]|uniref:B box-type domain-containing protein n=1 Tax=Didymodactylos carnosus TaxID=1234261 RepID=A0A814SW78_9BILA|nr:unnamed protein product [Didymodactylos carnosus]CAF3914751.1 unnamed protein product [Didymodactylos carnosus]
MMSAATNKSCATCHNAGDVFMCHGCRQFFCAQHTTTHREELSKDMDKLTKDYELLQRDLIRGNGPHPLLCAIDTWEQEQITKIRNCAETARADLRQSIERIKNKIEKTLDMITDELESSRESEDYTEIDFKRWNHQLEEFRSRIEKPLNTEIIEDDDIPPIHLIKVGENRDQQQSRSTARSFFTSEISLRSIQEPPLLVREKFEEAAGPATVSEDGLLATYSGSWTGDSSISGVNLYSSGTHHIRFRIQEMFYNSPFFGINGAPQEMSARDFEPPSADVSSNLGFPIANGKNQWIGRDRIIRAGDEVTLILDCDRRQIFLEHHRTNRLLHLPIDLRVCPLPWKIVIVLRRRGDCVRIRGGTLSLTKQNLTVNFSEKRKN